MNGSPENLAVTPIIVQLKEALSANKDVFNNIMLACVQQKLITLGFMKELLTTSDTSLSTKAILFVSSIQTVLTHGSSYLDNFLTVLVDYGDSCCKEIAIKIANNYNDSDQLLPNYQQAITRNTTNDEGNDNIDTRSFFQLLCEAKDILISILKRIKRCMEFVVRKCHKYFFFMLVFLFTWWVNSINYFDNIYCCVYFQFVCQLLYTLQNKNHLITDVLIYGLIFSFGLNLMDVKMQNDMQITTDRSINHAVIGGQPDSINWLEEGFKMDIFPGSFPPDIPVNITISLHQSNYTNFQLVTQVYTITSNYSTSEFFERVEVHLTHNLVFDNIPLPRILLFDGDDTHNKSDLLSLPRLSKYYITSSIQMKTNFNIGFVFIHTYNNNAYDQVYNVSFYAKEEHDYMIVVAVVTFPGDKLTNLKYSNWKKDPYSPHKVKMIKDNTDLIVKPGGCWNKLESEEYTQIIQKGEYSFKLQWKCLWWPHKTYLELNNSQSGINAYIYTNASGVVVAFAHSIILFGKSQVVVLFVKITYTVSMISIIRYLYFHDRLLINKIVYTILLLLNTCFFEILKITNYFTFQVQWPLVLFDASLCIYLFFMVAS